MCGECHQPLCPTARLKNPLDIRRIEKPGTERSPEMTAKMKDISEAAFTNYFSEDFVDEDSNE